MSAFSVISVSSGIAMTYDSDSDDSSITPRAWSAEKYYYESDAYLKPLSKQKKAFERNLKGAIARGSKHDVVEIIKASQTFRYLESTGSQYLSAIFSAYLESARYGEIEIFEHFETISFVADHKRAFIAAIEGPQPKMAAYLLEKIPRIDSILLQEAYERAKEKHNSKCLQLMQSLKAEGKITFEERRSRVRG